MSSLPTPSSQIVFVLGSHRSGTSAITRLLWLLGLELGPEQEMLAAREGDNAKGFQEQRAILELNESILRRRGGSWRRPPELADGWESDDELADLRARARQLVARYFGDARAWALKDPRAALTLPFWKGVVTPTAYVICHRHPLAVASSLERRNQLALEDGVALWARYTASAIANTAGERRLIVSYTELFSHRRAAILELASFLGRAHQAGQREFEIAVDAWLEEELRHHDPPLRALVEHPAMSAEAVELCLLLELAVHAGRVPPRAGAAPRDGDAGGAAGAVSDALDALAIRLAGRGPRHQAQALIGPG